MAEATTIAGRVLDVLVTSGHITADQLAGVRGMSADDGEAGRTLVDRGLITPVQLSAVLEDDLGIPRVDLASYAPDDEALALVPAAVARARRVLPLFEIEGMLTIAIGDPADVFMLDELSAELRVEIEAVLADAPAVDGAVLQYYGAPVAEPAVAPAFGAPPLAPPTEELEISAADFFDVGEDSVLVSEAPPSEAHDLIEESANLAQTVEEVVAAETPAGPAPVDLDVLAVADDRKVAVLVADILGQAVSRGASRIHLLPYKTDFFLVFRIKGRLEKIASAPLTMQGPLNEGFKNYAKLGRVPLDVPALGRLHAEIGGKQLVLTVSSVPTVAGQRLVVSLSPARPQPRDLVELGMSEAESRALQAMVERGRGMLLVAAPVAGGRSSTYYALLQHAAAVGKTAYSVERAIEYEIPAVAQVLVNPGSPVGAASYFAAGIRQDTDVLAIDAMQTVEEVHLAIEAAGMGKLVIATFAGADVVTAVRRMLDLGAEPVSLASALTLGVGQRVVRTSCPSCSADERIALTDRIPGAEKGMTTRHGTGCPNCGKTGFAGATGIFEVLPFTEPVRAQIAVGASAEQLAAAARAAGMRPMVASGLAKVRDGVVSTEELDRVLRFGA
ncbi:MAG: GspE/PulE family protein [Gaiellaceae bacterium]